MTTLALPGTLTVGLIRSGAELKEFFRHKE